MKRITAVSNTPADLLKVSGVTEIDRPRSWYPSMAGALTVVGPNGAIPGTYTAVVLETEQELIDLMTMSPGPELDQARWFIVSGGLDLCEAS